MSFAGMSAGFFETIAAASGLEFGNDGRSWIAIVAAAGAEVFGIKKAAEVWVKKFIMEATATEKIGIGAEAA